MAEDVTTQVLESEEKTEEVTQVLEEKKEVSTDENQGNVKAEATTEPAEMSVEDIISGKKPAEDTTPAWAKKRFDELTTKIYEAKREAEHWKEQATKNVAIPTERPLPPVESEFIDPDEYRKARVSYEDKLDTWKSSQRQNTEFQERQNAELQENLSKFNERAAKMRKKYADFDDAINEPVFTPVMSREITASDFGAEIGYYLAKNPAEALKLSKLPPTGVAKEIGKLEVKFSQATKKLNSNAPPPITPIKGDDVPVKDPKKMTDDEWYQWDKQQKLKKLKPGG